MSDSWGTRTKRTDACKTEAQAQELVYKLYAKRERLEAIEKCYEMKVEAILDEQRALLDRFPCLKLGMKKE